MKTEKELRKVTQRAEQAKMILNNPLIVEYFAQKREDIMINLSTCKYWTDPNERDALLNMLKCIHTFEKEFTEHIKDGKKALTLLERLLGK